MSDEELVRRLKYDRDYSAFEELIKRHAVRLAVWIRRGFRGLDADDVVQETFLKVWLKIETYKDDFGFRAWIYKIALNEARDRFRRESRLPQAEFCDQIGQTSSADQKTIKFVNDGLDALDENDREILTLTYWEGFKIEEIGKMFGEPTGTIASRISRARTKLKKILNPDEGETHENR